MTDLTKTAEWSQRKLAAIIRVLCRALWFAFDSLPMAAGFVFFQVLMANCHPESITWQGFVWTCGIGWWMAITVRMGVRE